MKLSITKDQWLNEVRRKLIAGGLIKPDVHLCMRSWECLYDEGMAPIMAIRENVGLPKSIEAGFNMTKPEQ